MKPKKIFFYCNVAKATKPPKAEERSKSVGEGGKRSAGEGGRKRNGAKKRERAWGASPSEIAGKRPSEPVHSPAGCYERNGRSEGDPRTRASEKTNGERRRATARACETRA